MSVADRDPLRGMQAQRVTGSQDAQIPAGAESVPHHGRGPSPSLRDGGAERSSQHADGSATGAGHPVIATGIPAGTHLFTVDVEEYFQVVALSPYAPRNRWGSFESRVEPAIDQLLDAMAARGATGTFFVVGWVAERHAGMVKRIAAAGHELASHTYDHKRITHQTRDAFRDSIRRTKQVLEDLTGTPVLGFRAPSFSIVRGTEWALDLLIEEGHSYDSSLFPVSRAGYGYSGGKRDPYWIDRPAGRIAEIPPATLQVLGKTIPAAGGAYFRILPPQLVHSALRSATARGVPGTFYIHPWEWDPGQPLLDVPMLTRVRHYCGQRNVFGRIERLLESFTFASIASVLGDEALGLRAGHRDGAHGGTAARTAAVRPSLSGAV
jgi:polysaccharide deacetylase family protein (PEP-CTERM system associated)